MHEVHSATQLHVGLAQYLFWPPRLASVDAHHHRHRHQHQYPNLLPCVAVLFVDPNEGLTRGLWLPNAQPLPGSNFAGC